MYFNGGLHGWNDAKLGYVPPEKTTRIYCDECAETEIPLPATGPYGDRVGRHFNTDFKWAPHYGGNTPCMKCGRHV